MATQQVGINGQNNVIVQIEGDNNAVNLKGLAHLTLTRYLTRRRIDSDIDLLSPYSRSIPLIGRAAELADLRVWLISEKPISIRVLTGRAGSGKTRLALELCERMLAEGWDAGFLESGELERFRAQQNLATWGWQRPTLIISDYAAVHADRLSNWFQELADNQGHPERPLRLMLLERNAETGSGWWQTAFGRGGFGARAVQRLLEPAEPVRVEPIMASEDRRVVIGRTLEKAESDQRPPEEGADSVFDQRLADQSWGGEPLFLMMAGLMARDIGMANVLSLRRTDLAFELAERELSRIARIGKGGGVNPDFMEAMAAYATLCQGLDAAWIRAAVAAEQAALGLPSAGDPGVVAKLLCDALPGENGAGQILPDMIGEAAILRALPRRYENSSGAAVVRAYEQFGPKAAATVIRVAQDFAGAGHLEPLKWLDALIERDSVDVDQLMLIADALPQTSLALAEHGARIHLRIERALRTEVEAGAKHLLPSLAMSLNNLAARLSALGRREDALRAAEEARDLYRALAADRPDAFTPYLAASLNNLAKVLSALGRREDALRAAEEARDLYRALAADRPDAFTPDLATSLNNLANGLSDLGRREDALRAAEEAVAIRRRLAADRPDAFTPDLAMSLNNLATMLSDLGRREDALRAAEEAVAIRRRLAADRPDAFTPNLAGSLNNLAARLSALGRREDALRAAEEARDLYRALAADRPDAFTPDLAGSLNNLATMLSDLGRREDALRAAEEARDLYRALAADRPDAFTPDLALSLSVMADRLEEFDRNAEGVEADEQAIGAIAPYFEAHPQAFAHRMMFIALGYLRRCEKLGREPDMRLLAPIVEMLQRMQEGPGREI